MSELFTNGKALMDVVATRAARSFTRKVGGEYDDNLSNGVLAVLERAHKYNPDRSAPETFAANIAWRGMRDARESDCRSRGVGISDTARTFLEPRAVTPFALEEFREGLSADAQTVLRELFGEFPRSCDGNGKYLFRRRLKALGLDGDRLAIAWAEVKEAFENF